MREIGIGIIGGGYMGKAHAVAMSAVGACFETNLRPRLEMVAATRDESAERYRARFGFRRATSDWRVLVSDPQVDAVIVASPPDTHLDIVTAAFAHGKHVFCEKPLGGSLAEGEKMCRAAKAARPLANMVGFNYIRTPAAQFIHQLLEAGEIGEITYFRGEHVEDYYANPATPASWRTRGVNNGALGDLAHIFNMALRFMGPIERINAEIETVHKMRPKIATDNADLEAVENDDQGQLMCRFQNGAMGYMHFSRIATGRKMGYACEIFGTKGAIRFDQEDQNAIWVYRSDAPEKEAGFKKILTGPAHPDYVNFNLGAGHGTGYQDQIIIEARDFLQAIETGAPVWPTFADGQGVNRIIAAIQSSSKQKAWVNLNEF